MNSIGELIKWKGAKHSPNGKHVSIYVHYVSLQWIPTVGGSDLIVEMELAITMILLYLATYVFCKTMENFLVMCIGLVSVRLHMPNTNRYFYDII